MLRDLLRVPEALTLDEERSAFDLFDQSMPGAFALPMGGTVAGPRVNDETSRRLSSVFACQRILSDGVSTLPVKVTEGLEGTGDARAVATPSWLLEPNGRDNSIDLMAQVMMSLLTRGNAYLATPRDESNKVVSLLVLEPSQVTPVRNSNLRGGVAYRLKRSDGTSAMFDRSEVLHIRALVKPGALVGLSPLDYARESIALGMAAQDYGAGFFGNSATPSAVVEIPGAMSDTAADLMRATWNDRHKGSQNSSKLAVFTEGASLKPVGITPEQAQFLQTRGFQVADIARFFGVPPHLIGDASGSTSWGSGLAEQSVNYVTHSLRPWVTRIETSLTWLARSEQALSAPTRRRRTITLQMDHLTRGDFSSRISTYRSGLESGLWCLDEVRAMENLPPLPDGAGCVHRVSLATAPLGSHDEQLSSIENDAPPGAPDPEGHTK